MKKKLLAVLLSCCSVALALALVGCGGSGSSADAESASAGDSASTEVAVEESNGEVIEIATAEDLAAISDNLAGDYVLTADIDLSGTEWTPIGTFMMPENMDEEAEGAEIPDENYAFTGTFDGGGHTISGLTINQPEGFALGLFGCISNAEVGNFTLENPTVDGTTMCADAVGYTYCSTVHDVTVEGGTVTAHASDFSAEGMYGAVVGAGMGSQIVGCTADAAITLPDNTANAGVIGGGLELTSVIDCTASGSVTAGANCYGLGGISGCGFGAEEFTNCVADGITITAGDGCFWIGGITGYAGGYEDASAGIPVTAFTGCVADNVTFDVPENLEGVGDIVGAGFFNEEAAAAYGAPYDQPTTFTIAA